MLRRVRVLGFALLVGGLCAIAAFALPGGASASSSRLGPPPLALNSTLKTSSVTAGTNWVDGMINEYSTFLYNPCGPFTPCYTVGSDDAYVGYLADTGAGSIAIPDGAYPQVGDVYYMHVVLTLMGNPGSAGDAPIIDIQLPANTQLAIDSTHKTYCFLSNSPNPLTCSFSPSTGTWLPISLGQVPLASYITFEEQFPVKTTAPLNGLCTQTPLNGTSIPGTVSPACLLNYNQWSLGSWSSTRTEFDYQGIYVPALALDTTISSKPTSSTTSTSATFSFSSNASGATFECKLDSASWASCSSSKAYSGLSVGSHTFQVRADQAIGYGGINQTRTDATPASYGWTISAPASGGSSTGGSSSGGSSSGGSKSGGSSSGGSKSGGSASPAASTSGKPALAFTAAHFTVKASASSARITIKRSGSTAKAVKVVFKTANGSAKAGANYTSVTKTITFAKGVKVRTVSVPIKKGSVHSGAKTVKLSLSKPSGAALGARKTALLSIVA